MLLPAEKRENKVGESSDGVSSPAFQTSHNSQSRAPAHEVRLHPNKWEPIMKMQIRFG
jgi:hypothetical protein